MQTRTIPAALCLSLLLLAVPLAAQQAPEEEKGFRPEKFYSFGSLDHVNTFNGNLMVSIPIGMRYPLDGGFTYGLSLTYNSKMWDFEEWNAWQKAYPSKRANAGLGWLLTMGRLVEPNDPTNPTNEWLYESPDGADHKFAASFLYTNIGCSGSYCADTWYTHDGSFLRMRKLSETLRTVESGDGTTSEFELMSDNWRLKRIYNAFKDASGNPLNYVNVTYPDPGTIAYCPGADVVWRLADSKGRIHFVCLKNQNVGGDQTPTVDRVLLEGVGQYATYVFEYDLDREVVENCQDTVPPTQETPVHAYDVPVLRRLKLPDGTDSSCTANDCARFEFDTYNGGCSSGALESVLLPTKGKISYTYEAKNIQPEEPCNLRPVDAVGVSTRKLWPATGTTPIGTWTYKVGRSLKGNANDYESYASCGTSPIGGGELHPLLYDEAVATVLDPAGNKFVQHFNTWPGNPGHTYNEISWDGFKKKEYGLPIGKFDPAANANRSREALGSCDANGNNCTLLRQSYVRYRLDPADWSASIAHRTIEAERTVYLDVPAGSPTRYAHVEYSDYDGFGHYRKATTSGSFDGDNVRETYTNFNPGSDLHGSVLGDLAFSTSAPWILGTYDTVTVTDATGSSTSKHCFDQTTGWLRAVRIGTQTSDKDLVTLFAPETNTPGGPSTGNIATEAFYGGDGTPLTAPSQSICTIANGGNPGAIGYRIRHTYSYGQRATSRHDGMPFLSLDRDIHPTGLTQATREEDGVAVTSYEYFRDGRLKRMVPSGEAATDYVYTHASVSGSSFTPALVKATTISTTAGAVETEYQFDALGRYWREKQRMPNGTWSLREMLYDALDRKTSVSEPATLTTSNELAFNPPHDTTFTNYDAFGRARTVTTPDNKVTTFVFNGVSQTKRTAGIATGQSSDTSVETTETYDRHGRLISVTEPGNIVTNYTYDVRDRLTMVTMGIQTRTFDYDSRGFLRWESHPEAGMTAYTYDARGHILTKTQSAASSLFDLTYLYDDAERPLEIRGRNPHYVPGNPDQPEFRLMKKFVYATANGTDDLRLGKLWTASRYNYDPGDPDGIIYKVSETWKYGDVAGRKTHRLTSIRKGVAGLDEAYWQDYREVQTEVVYNDLNLPQTVKYPSCLNCGTNSGVPVPVRDQAYTYTTGRLATVPGVLNSISYWPNGMWNTMGRSNNMTDTQTLDSGMARPASISAALSDSCAVPVITSDPVGGTVTPSSPVLLSVSVSGTGPFTYEWWNETQLVGNGPTFTATSANTLVTSRYRVLVMNACKTVESIAATVSVGECIAPGASATFEPKAGGGYTLIATGTGTEPRTYTWRRTSDQALIGTGRRVSIGPLTQTTSYTVTVANSCAGSPRTANVSVDVQSAMQAVLTAVRTPNTNQIHVTWTGPTSGVTYTLQRRSGAGWEDHVTLSAAALSARAYDDSVAAGKTYAYRLKNDDEQTSNADVATTTTSTQIPVDAQITNSSWNSVFTAINSVRAAAGWPAVAWSNILSSNDPLPAPGEHIRAVHVMSTRARMNEALQALGVTVQPYTPGDVKGAKVEASHLNDIMNRAN